jgi:hypothetical protein
MSNRSVHYRRASLGPGTTAACGTVTSSMTADPAEVTCKRCLKTIETGSAESGYLAGSEQNQEHKMSEKIAERIALLLNKAERTTPEEAEALTAAAEKLMAKYLIDQATIDARRAKQGKASEKIIEKHFAFRGAYRGEMLHLGHSIARSLGTLRSFQNTGYDNGKTFMLWIAGFESDVEQAELLINSLQLQAAVAVRAWWKEHKPVYEWMNSYEQEKARRSFVHGFGTGAASRLRESRQQVVQEASTGTELVLVDRKTQVDAYMDQTHKLGKGRARNATGGDGAATYGYAAGREANTGGRSVTQSRGISA